MQFPRIIRPLMLAALCAAAGCTYIIPEDTNPPRYNKVTGQRKVPELNQQVGPQSQVQPAPAPVAMQSPPQNPAMAPLPPVDPQTRAIAAQEMAQPSYQAVPPQEEKGFWSRMAFWRDDEPEVAAAPTSSYSTRRAPSGNNEYPVLSQVPAAPANGSEVDRMAYVRAELERDRVNAALAKDQLAAEAAAEPSLLSQMPVTGAAPSPEPVSIAPLPPPPPLAAPTPMSYTPPSVAPPVTYFPPAQTAMEPIVLRPPATAPAPMPAPAYTPMSYASPPKAVQSYTPSAPSAAASSSAMPAPMAGGFNPMVEPTPIQLQRPGSAYANGNYLPESRYSSRRY